jgi:hypothetical protein
MPKTAMAASTLTLDKWHQSLGHPNSQKLQSLVCNNLLSTSSNNVSPCSSCILGKISHLSLASVEHTSTTPFQIIHSDVWGPAPMLSSMGHHFFMLFIDDFTHFTWIYFLKYKSDVYEIYLNFKKLVERQFKTKIQAFHSNCGGEYQKLNQYFK